MARVKKPQVMKMKLVNVLVKKFKVKIKKVSVKLMSMKLSVNKSKELSMKRTPKLGKKTFNDQSVVVKVFKDNPRQLVTQKSKPRNNLANKDIIETVFVSNQSEFTTCEGVVAEIKDCLTKGEVTRLKRSLKSSCASYVLGSQKSIQEDDEDSPKKKVPTWAEEKLIMIAISKQVDVDTDLIFASCDVPDLSLMFPITASNRRDIWNSPTSSQAITATPQPSSPPVAASDEEDEISFNLVAREKKTDNKHRRGEHKQQNLITNRKVLFKSESPSRNAGVKPVKK